MAESKSLTKLKLRAVKAYPKVVSASKAGRWNNRGAKKAK